MKSSNTVELRDHIQSMAGSISAEKAVIGITLPYILGRLTIPVKEAAVGVAEAGLIGFEDGTGLVRIVGRASPPP
jgi:hypothetical protein